MDIKPTNQTPASAGGSGVVDARVVELSVVMPCLNEARTLGVCIEKALGFFAEVGVVGEVVVADNGSTDGSVGIAEGLGVRVMHVAERGYGSALSAGIAAARGRYIIMGDADGSYDFSALGPFLERLRGGDDLVMGNRFTGGIRDGAMPALHRYLGNPMLTGIGRLFFKSECGDFYCGLRGFSREGYQRMRPRSGGMEFALEMLVRATIFGLRVSEVPTTLSRDAPGRAPHLRTWRDGWRSLRFFMLFSPRWLFWYPGLVLMAAGMLVGLWLLPGPKTVGGVTLDVHTLLYAATAATLGYQSILFAVCAKVHAVNTGLHPPSRRFAWAGSRSMLEVGLVVGGLLVIGGVVIGGLAVGGWSGQGFGNLDPFSTMRLVIPSALALMMGVQTVFAGYFLGLLGMRGDL